MKNLTAKKEQLTPLIVINLVKCHAGYLRLNLVYAEIERGLHYN